MGVGMIVGGALGLAGSVMSSRAQKKAAGRAAEATENASREQVALQREIFNQQRADLEPFRQQELQRAGALGEVFGFMPVTGNPANSAPGFAGGTFGSGGQFAYTRNQLAPQVAGSGFDPDAYLSLNPDVRDAFTRSGGNRHTDIDTWARQHAHNFGYRENRPGLPGTPPGSRPVARDFRDLQGDTPEPVTMQSQQDAARARFEGSMFNDVYRDGHRRDVTRIDSGLASQGMAFSGARMQAVEDARADRFGSTFNAYMASLMGQAPTTATQSTNAAAGAFGANASNAIAQRGAGQAQSAYASGQASANMWNGIAGLGGFAMGGGFG